MPVSSQQLRFFDHEADVFVPPTNFEGRSGVGAGLWLRLPKEPVIWSMNRVSAGRSRFPRGKLAVVRR
jgi:hypothetical protein